ncbi:MAG: hypothetical protein K0Q67_3196 [Cellvibrio sp.]|nr:hypothetical protein [Cellvibrio sp.]
MENMTDYQYAWMMYLVGAIGCSLATWLLFRRAGRAWVHFFVITVMVILFTPYAIDAEQMIMAPAIYSMVFGYFDGGFISIKPILKVMLGIWICTLILSLLYQLLTRGRAQAAKEQDYHHQGHRTGQSRTSQSRTERGRTNQKGYVGQEDQDDYDYSPAETRRASSRGLSREERIARDELLHEEPIRAIR